MTAIPNDPAPQKDWAMISVGAANIMISEATSFYVPSCAVLDAAIQSFVPESEFIHHEGYEAYSRGRGYLITAGGVETEAVNTVKDLGPLGDALNQRDDHGAAFPTTLMLNDSAFNTTLDSFIRIEGKKDKPGPNESFEGDLFVIGNFACGINLVVPDAINHCLVADAGTPPQWEFLDVKSCPAFGADPDKRPFAVCRHLPGRVPDKRHRLHQQFRLLRSRRRRRPAYVPQVRAADPGSKSVRLHQRDERDLPYRDQRGRSRRGGCL